MKPSEKHRERADAIAGYIKTLAEGGCYVAEAARKLGVSEQTIRNYRKKYNIKFADGRHISSGGKPRNTKRDEIIIGLVRDGWSSAKIAKAFGMTRGRICQIMMQHGGARNIRAAA